MVWWMKCIKDFANFYFSFLLLQILRLRSGETKNPDSYRDQIEYIPTCLPVGRFREGSLIKLMYYCGLYIGNLPAGRQVLLLEIMSSLYCRILTLQTEKEDKLYSLLH